MSDEKHPTDFLAQISGAFGIPHEKIQAIGMAPVKPVTVTVPLQILVYEPTQPRQISKQWRDPWAVVLIGERRLGSFTLDTTTGALQMLADELHDEARLVDSLWPGDRLPGDVEATIHEQLRAAQQRAWLIRADYYAAKAKGENSGGAKP